jgi:alkylation response protein AidB-like acyl-CoA dehydrogenase
MGLAITQDHRALEQVVRSFARDHDLRGQQRRALEASGEPTSDGSGPSWKQICDLGWAGLHLPEEVGGSGYGLAELAVVVEQLGAAAAPGPFLPTVISAAVLDRVADEATRSRLLPGLADGSTLGAVALGGRLTRDGDRLRGSTALIPAGQWADQVLIVLGDDVLLVQTAAAGVTVEPVAGVDPGLGCARLRLDGADVVTLPGAAPVAVRVARALAAAEAAGGARAALAMALDYAKVREQFGRIIGSFQAVKHHLANMLIDTERATAVAWDAARAIDRCGRGESADSRAGDSRAGDSRAGDSRTDEAAQADLACAVAAAVALEAYQRGAQQNIQILGGIGFTWEHDAHLYLRRAIGLAAVWGPVDAALDDVTRLRRSGVTRDYSVELPAEAEAFREQARGFVARYRGTPEPDRRRVIAESGYLVPHWPAPWGRAATAVEQLVIEEELRGVDVPALGIGGWVLLTLVQQAAPEQVERWIPPSLVGDLTWCQLFSEPNAGSDAAAVQTRAVRADGGWRVSGQKVWTSDARSCNRGLATVRTDPTAAKHQGITTMVIDLAAPGVEIRRLREITGHALFNEVFFDDVFVPDDDVVGPVNGGWTVARATLGNERVSIGGAAAPDRSAAGLLPLLEATAPDAGLLRDFGRVAVQEQALRLINLRQVTRAVTGADPGAEGSVTKLLFAEQTQRLAEYGLRLAGQAGVDGSLPQLTEGYLYSRAMTIAGGTSEIARNVIAERLLGLPRDPLLR